MRHPAQIGGWLRTTLLVLLVIIAGLGLVIGYVSLNPNTLKPLAAYLTGKLIGRTLTIDGDLSLDLSLKPRISVRNAQLSNAAWSSSPVMARVDYLLVQIDLPQLFHRQVRLLDLDVKDGELILEDPVDGKPNWSFQDGDDAASTGETDWSFIVEGLEVTDSTLRLVLGELEPMKIEIPSLVESTDAKGYLTLDGKGRLNGQPWQVKGRIGTFAELLAAGHVDLDLDLEVENVSLKATGSIGDLQRFSALNLTLGLHGPDADLLGTLFRMPEVFSEDVALDASIRPAGEVHDIEIVGHVSRFSVDVKGTVGDLRNFDGWDGTVSVQGPDAAAIAKALQITGLPGGPFELSGRVHRHGGDLDLADVHATFSGSELTLAADFTHFPDHTGASIRGSLTGDDLGYYRTFLRLPDLPAGLPFRVDLTLDAAPGATDRFVSSIIVGDNQLDAKGSLGAYPGFDGTRLSVTASGQAVEKLAGFAGQDIPLTGPYRLTTVLGLSAGGLTATDTRAEVESMKFSGTIQVPDLDEPKKLSVDGSLTTEDVASLTGELDLKALSSGPLSVSARVTSDGQRWRLERGKGELARVGFTASGALGTLTSPSGVDLKVEVQGPDINTLFDNALPNAEETPFTLTSRVRGSDEAIDVEGLTLVAQGGRLQADGHITFANALVGSRITLTGEGLNLAHLLPSFPQYQPSTRPWKIGGAVGIPAAGHLEISDGSAQVGSVQMSASGVADVRNQDQTHLTLTISGNAIHDLGRIGGLDWPKMAFSLSTELDGSTDAINISKLQARWGKSDLEATGAIDLTAKPRITLNGSSSLLRIIEIQQAIPEPAEDTESAGDDEQERVIPDRPIHLDLLARQDLSANVSVKRFEGRRSSLNDVDLLVGIEDGTLHLERVRYRDQYGYFDAEGTLGPTTDAGVAELVLKVKGEDADLGLFTSPDQPKDTRPTYNLDISIRGTGTTVAELAGNLDGTVLVWSDGGQINNSILQAYASDFMMNVLDTLNPFTKSEPYTKVQCLVLNAVVEQGKVKLTPGFVMRTSRLNMFVVGDVNLKTERLNLSLATQARQGIGISAATLTNPYFKVGGSLTAPQLELDAPSAAVAASVAAATAGLSIVVRGVWSRLMGEQNPCPQFLKYKRKPEDTSIGNTTQPSR